MGIIVKNKLIRQSNLLNLDTEIKDFFQNLENGTQILHINTFFEPDATGSNYIFVCIYADPLKISPISSVNLGNYAQSP